MIGSRENAIRLGKRNLNSFGSATVCEIETSKLTRAGVQSAQIEGTLPAGFAQQHLPP